MQRAEQCLSCGACVGACPAARTSTYNFRKILRDILYGNEEKVLSSREIWYCFYCFYCTSKCPSRIEIPYMIMRMRRLAMERGYGGDMLRILVSLGRNLLNSGVSVHPRDWDRLNPAGAEKTISELRERVGLPPAMRVSEEAMKELKVIFDESGFREEVEGILSGKAYVRAVSEKYK
ncbi:MAG: 4Fe-4S dicluster domain-containing protein [Candidatus Freyarchaeota archaeon]|nr:4Fe-4S dicluster domain-containing protein [Candidatus Freyrarchaeum guaymaensis]